MIFADVVGQDHITELLQRAITSGRIAHAFLFCGPRGIGKTSCARILAKSLNCEKGPTLKPCGVCSACKEITAASSFDVLEIDGASNRGIDEIRTLRENVKFAPSYGRYKIYIVDEVHMLTSEAFNALLKTLEEPPEHVIFILATTDPNKVPATIISRCQRFDFKRITLKSIVDVLAGICQKEKFDIEQDALYAMAKASQGSVRDALSILDQMGALSERRIQGKDVYTMLGLIELDRLFALSDALLQKDCTAALRIFDEIIEAGKDIKQMGRDMIEHFRNLMVMKIGGKTLGRLLDYPVAVKEMYFQQSAQISLPGILKAIDAFIEAQDVARTTETLRLPLEIAFAKLTVMSADEKPVARPAAHKTESPAPYNSSAKAQAVAAKFSAVEILKNQKGQVNASSEKLEKVPAEEAPMPIPERPVQVPSGEIGLEFIQKSWTALTSAVSRKKMSLATYLQEGIPVAFQAGKLTVGFAAEFQFHKDTLESEEYRKQIEQIFSEQLKEKILIEYKIVDGITPHHEEDEPLVKSALETFQGRIVNKWHL